MIESLKSFLEKTLTSRKFWAAVGASVPFAMAQDWQNFGLVWCGYLTVQGAVDAAENIGGRKQK